MSLPQWILTPSIRRARLKGLGAVVGLVIAGAAVFALMHALKNVDYNEVFAAVRRTDSRLIALALMFVAISYASLPLYDLLALRTIGHRDVSYRIAALASFTSYPIAHGMGAVALVSPIIIAALWNAIDRTGSDKVRVIFRTAGTGSPLESAELAPLRQIWHRDQERSAAGFEADRSGIYGGFHCYGRR